MKMKLIIYLLLMTTCLTGLAQEKEKETVVQAQVSAKSFYMGQRFTYTILIDGSNKVLPPAIKNIKGFQLKKIEERPLTSKEKPGFIIRYDVIPLEAGELTIPPVNLKVNSQIFTTEEIKIDSKKPAKHSGLKLSMLISSNEVYSGEPLLLTFIWESELPLYALKAVDVKLPFHTSPAFKSSLPWNSPKGGDEETIGLPVSNVRTICSHEIVYRNEKRLEILKFQKVITPRYSGEFTIDPAILLCSFIPDNLKDFRKGRKNWKPSYPSFFNNNFFEQTGNVEHIKYTAESNSLKIKVKDLPSEGRPDDFYGIVGKCKVSATADPVILEAGSPLHLAIKISNYDFPSILQMPDFKKLNTFNRSFSIPKQKSQGEYRDKDKIFYQTLRPLRTDVNEIPPVRVPYFDPQSGTYNVAQSPPISLTVKPAGKVTAFDAMLSSGTNLKNRLEENPEGIRHNTISVSDLNTKPLSPLVYFLFAALLPPIIFIIFKLSTEGQRLSLQSPIRARALKAYKNFRKAISASSNIPEVEKCVRNYFANKLNLTADAHTCNELIEIISTDISLENQEEKDLYLIYDSFDLQRFKSADETPNHQEVIKTAQNLISTLDKRFKHV